MKKALERGVNPNTTPDPKPYLGDTQEVNSIQIMISQAVNDLVPEGDLTTVTDELFSQQIYQLLIQIHQAITADSWGLKPTHNHEVQRLSSEIKKTVTALERLGHAQVASKINRLELNVKAQSFAQQRHRMTQEHDPWRRRQLRLKMLLRKLYWGY